MRCLVTGASGFLGAALVPKLLERGHSPIILVRPSSNVNRLQQFLPRLEVLHGDILRLGCGVRFYGADTGPLIGLDAALGSVEAVFHLAWPGVTAEFRNDPNQIRKNLTATLDLWDLARAASCKVWIGVGSQAEYGPVHDVLREDTPTFPVTAYGVAKLASGLATAKMSELCGMRHAWLRLLSAYGPGDDDRHMIPSVINAFLAGRRPALTAGEQIWDYIFVDDVCEALCAVLETDASGVFNLGSGIATPLRSVVEQIRNLIDPRLPIGFGDIPYSPDQVMRLEVDISRLRSATGWTPGTKLSDGLTQTVALARRQAQDLEGR